MQAMEQARTAQRAYEAATHRDLYAEGWDAGVAWTVSLLREAAAINRTYTAAQLAAFVIERNQRN